MEKEVPNSVVKFLSWETTEKLNDTTQYKGLVFKQNLAENLFVLIECCNEKAIWSTHDNLIRFSFCTHNDFPIVSVQYKFCSDGYYAGIAKLIEWSKTFEKAFYDFREKSELED